MCRNIFWKAQHSPVLKIAAPGRWPTVPLQGRHLVNAKKKFWHCWWGGPPCPPSAQADGSPQAPSRDFSRRATSLLALLLSLLTSSLPAFSQAQTAPATALPAVPYPVLGVMQPTALQAATLQGEIPPDNAIWLETLDLRNMTAGWGEPRIAKSVDWKPLTLKGTVYAHGIGAHAHTQITIDLKGAAQRFVTLVGVDDETEGKGSVVVTVVVDGKKVVDTGPLQGGAAPQFIAVNVDHARRMVIDATPTTTENRYCHVDWAGAMLVLDPDAKERPESVDLAPHDVTFKLPPVPRPDLQPAIHGARVMGASPHRPFVWLVPVTGKGPFTYSAANLPTGLKLDAKTGVISGVTGDAGNYDFAVTVKSVSGKATQNFSLVCGDHKLALTPPLGWNAWNVYGATVTADEVRDQADWLVSSGLAARGFQYIIIDDTWQGRRDADGNIGANKRFGDIKSLADYVHAKGLRLGIASSPNEATCSGYAGSGGYEAKDAAFYASVGIDYLKYDWCQPGGTRKDTTADVLKTSYSKMRGALDKVNRDIVYELTPYGFGKVWEWGAAVGANSWTTDAQIIDKWESVQNNGFSQNEHFKFAGPGHWNSPGWLMLGRMNPTTPRFPHLRPNEQMTQVTLWSVLAAPLILSCDLSQLNPNSFYPVTTTLLNNDEVLAINQDALGIPGRRVDGQNDSEVWAKPLVDGTTAVAFFNKANRTQDVTVHWWGIDKRDSQPIWDVWNHKDLGRNTDKDAYTVAVPAHGAALLKIGQPLTLTNQFAGLNKPVYMLSSWAWGDGLHWIYSRNGNDWLALPRDKTWFKATVGDKRFSNDSITRGPDGLARMVWASGDNDKGFGYATSKDNLTWDEQTFIPVDKGALAGGAKWVHHPKIFYDKPTGNYVLTWSAIVQPEPPKMRGFRMYYMTTKDFKTFSDPQLLFDPGYSSANANLVAAHGRYFLIFRDEDKRLLRVTSATAPAGPFDTKADPLPVGKDVDEPTVVQRNNAWYVYFTRHVGPESTGVARSQDLTNWTDISAQPSFPRDHHFGSMVTTTEATLQAMLRTAYQSQ